MIFGLILVACFLSCCFIIGFIDPDAAAQEARRVKAQIRDPGRDP